MHPLYSVPNFITSGLTLALGIFVVVMRPNEKITRLFGLLSASVALWLFGYALIFAVATNPDQALKLARFAYIGVVFIPTFFLHFVNEFLQLRRRSMVFTAYVLSFVFLYIIRQDYFMNGVYLYFWGYYPKAGAIYWSWLVYFYAAFAICDYEFIKAYIAGRRAAANSLRTKQLKYVLWANCAATVSLMDYLPKFGWKVYPCAYLAAMSWLVLMAYAIVKFRLMDVQLIIRKTLIYSFVSAVLTTVYFLVVTLFANFSSGVIGKSSWISIAAAGVVVTLIFLPIFRKVQALIDRLFFRFRIDRETRLMELSSKIIQQETTQRLTQSLCETVDEFLHPKNLGLYLQTARDRDFLEVAGWRLPPSWNRVLPAQNPWSAHFAKDHQPLLWEPYDRRSEDRSLVQSEMVRMDVHAALPLMSRDNVLGFLLLGGKRSEESYSNEDLILLRIIANQATVAFERPMLVQEVSGGFAHEIKTPLSKISLPAELTYLEIERVLKERGDPDQFLENIQRRMRFIMDQAKLAAQRVDALQELGAQDMNREPQNVAGVVRKSLAAVEDVMTRARVEVTVEIPSDLPAVRGDAEQLEILFTNLFKNAVEAIANLSPGKDRMIKVRAREEGSHCLIEVEDSGPGVSLEDRERIFQSHYTTKGANGAGMGLFLCRQIVQAHGGKIDVKCPKENATAFTFTLPTT